MATERVLAALALAVTGACSASHDCVDEVPPGTIALEDGAPFGRFEAGASACAEIGETGSERSLVVSVQGYSTGSSGVRMLTTLVATAQPSSSDPLECPGRVVRAPTTMRFAPPPEGWPAFVETTGDLWIARLRFEAEGPHAWGTLALTEDGFDTQGPFDAPPCEL